MPEFERVFVRFRGRTIGPFTPDKIKEMVRRGQVTRMHELSGDGLSWMKADEFGNFFPKAVQAGSVAGDMAASASDVPPGEGGAMAPNENATAQWYAHVDGEKQGPVSMDQMRLYAEAKILKKDSLVWKNGMQSWQAAAEVIPELFGSPAPSAGSSPASATVVADSGGASEATGPLASELCKPHALVMTLGIGLLVIAATLVIAQILLLNQGGRQLKSTPMIAAVKIALAGVATVSGIMAVQTASKLRAAGEAASPIQTLNAVRALKQFWLFTTIALMIWIGIVVLVAIAAMVMNVPVLKIIS
ncbi:MAG: DUF4339 domain-containing protein [Planctomycetota bacterium]